MNEVRVLPPKEFRHLIDKFEEGTSDQIRILQYLFYYSIIATIFQQKNIYFWGLCDFFYKKNIVARTGKLFLKIELYLIGSNFENHKKS